MASLRKGPLSRDMKEVGECAGQLAGPGAFQGATGFQQYNFKGLVGYLCASSPSPAFLVTFN